MNLTNATRWFVTISALSAMVSGCDKTPGETAKAPIPAHQEYDYAYDKREVYVADASNDLTALDRQINDLADQAAAAGEKVTTNAQPRIQELRHQRAALISKLTNLKGATEANWNTAKSDYTRSYQAMKTSCQQTWQWLKEQSGSF